ncbi:MAG: hypothetical protein LBJ93_02080 [Clostridiales bacterium]|jgi:hypothetical protein|nr:hypothetical protein [Clostridiales bacterium]
MQSEIISTKFKIKYSDKNGSFTFNKIKKSGIRDIDILNTAKDFALLQKYEVDKIFKIIDTKLSDIN